MKPNYFTHSGFALVSINYRLRWDYKIYDQVVELVNTIRWVQEHGAEFGLDANRIVMMGHGAGGHLVSLVMAASPQTHVSKKPNLPPFALLYNPERDITTLQAKGFAKALTGAGSELVMFPGSVTDPARTNELIGVSGNIAMVALMAFIPSQI